jgi:hypothetical protein
MNKRRLVDGGFGITLLLTALQGIFQNRSDGLFVWLFGKAYENLSKSIIIIILLVTAIIILCVYFYIILKKQKEKYEHLILESRNDFEKSLLDYRNKYENKIRINYEPFGSYNEIKRIIKDDRPKRMKFSSLYFHMLTKNKGVFNKYEYESMLGVLSEHLDDLSRNRGEGKYNLVLNKEMDLKQMANFLYNRHLLDKVRPFETDIASPIDIFVTEKRTVLQFASNNRDAMFSVAISIEDEALAAAIDKWYSDVIKPEPIDLEALLDA